MQVAVGGNLKHLLDPIIRKVFWDQYNQIPPVRESLFSVRNSTRWQEREFAMGSLGTIEEFDGTLDYDTFEGLWAKDFVHKEYAKGLEIQRRLIDDDQWDTIIKQPRMMATALAYTQEDHGASVLNNAFTAGATAGPDGVALCSASHPYSPTDTTTQSNTTTNTISHSSLVTARIAMAGWYDDRGKRILTRPDTLIVPRALEEQAYMLLQTERVVDAANWNKSIVANQYNFRVVVWDFLSSTTAWFLVDSNLMRENLIWYNRVAPQVNSEQDFDTFAYRWSIYARYSYGFYDWRWIYGSTGA